TLSTDGNGIIDDHAEDPTKTHPEDAKIGSYRGVVTPISRWGCAANDFVGIVSEAFWTNVMSWFIPFFGNFVALTSKVKHAMELIHHLGEFTQTILSVGLAAQVLFRIIMINFYLLMGPVAAGSWAFGGAGQEMFMQWFKGFCSLLFT